MKQRSDRRVLGFLIVLVLSLIAEPAVTAQVRQQRDRVVTPQLRRIVRPLVPQAGMPLRLTPERAAAFVLARDRGLDYVPGEVIVKFRSGITTAGQQRALQSLRGRPQVSALRWIGDSAVLHDYAQTDSHALAAELARQPEVEFAEPNYILRVPKTRRAAARPLRARMDAGLTPNDPEFQDLQWNLRIMDIDRAWDIQPGGDPDLVVAVVDTGVTTVNQNFTFPIWTGFSIQNFSLPFRVSPDFDASRFVPGEDFVFASPGGVLLDMEGHGTHMAATIAQETNNAIATAGIAYRVKIMPIKSCITYWELQIVRSQSGIPGFVPPDAGDCPSDAIAQGIRHAAENGAKVINVSLGGPGQSQAIRSAITFAVQRGAFVVAAMGNEGDDDNDTSFPAGDAPSIEGLMSVAAIGQSKRRAPYSSRGSHAEIAAPGGDFDDGGDEGGIWQVSIDFELNDPFTVIVPQFDQYALIGTQGTSSATAHIAGIAALIMSQGVTNPAAVEALIRATAEDIAAAGRDNDTGHGLANARRALRGLGIAR
jgi:serine protease